MTTEMGKYFTSAGLSNGQRMSIMSSILILAVICFGQPVGSSPVQIRKNLWTSSPGIQTNGYTERDIEEDTGIHPSSLLRALDGPYVGRRIPLWLHTLLSGPRSEISSRGGYKWSTKGDQNTEGSNNGVAINSGGVISGEAWKRGSNEMQSQEDNSLSDFQDLIGMSEGNGRTAEDLEAEKMRLTLKYFNQIYRELYLQHYGKPTEDVLSFKSKRKFGNKRGTGACINSCLAGGMSFVRCKSMCN